MADASDKARFYLERSVPELQELKRKKIFTKEEITSIARKRSDFEHKLNARGSSPHDYARYAEYEINLDALRRKRSVRLGIKASTHSGERKVFFILERGVRKFQGDLRLWIQYIEYARKQNANNKLSEIFTNVLRMHPVKPELWIYAAKYALEGQGDMTAARGYFQRGLRFCKQSKEMWLEYAKLEMMFMAKTAARRRILGLNDTQTDEMEPPNSHESSEDLILLPKLYAADFSPDGPSDGLDQLLAAEDLKSNPAMSGAIPIAIFDAAMVQFKESDNLAEMFFELCATFHEVPYVNKILRHIIERMEASSPLSPLTLVCYVKEPLVGILPESPDYDKGVSICLQRVKEAMSKTHNTAELKEKISGWLSLHSL